MALPLVVIHRNKLPANPRSSGGKDVMQCLIHRQALAAFPLTASGPPVRWLENWAVDINESRLHSWNRVVNNL